MSDYIARIEGCEKRDEPPTKPCPRCGGKGFLEDGKVPGFGGAAVQCWTCDGTGKVDPDFKLAGPWT